MAEGQGRPKLIWPATYVGNVEAAGKRALTFQCRLESDPDRVILVRVPASRVVGIIRSWSLAARNLGVHPNHDSGKYK